MRDWEDANKKGKRGKEERMQEDFGEKEKRGRQLITRIYIQIEKEKNYT